MLYAIINQNGGTEIRNDSTVDLPLGGVLLNNIQFEQLSSGDFILQNGEIIAAQPISVDVIWIKIKAERDRRKSSGIKIVIGGIDKWFHSDTDSRIQLFGLKDKARDMLASGGALTDNITILGNTVNWKTMDGTFVTMTGQLAFDIVTKTGDIDALLHAKAELHKAQMLVSPTPSTYDYSTGWSLIYGEV